MVLGMKYRFDLWAITQLVGYAVILTCLVFAFTRCSGLEYGPQPPTRVWEMHEESIHGAVLPEPSPIDWDKDPDYQ
jgi:hypothetical protein